MRAEQVFEAQVLHELPARGRFSVWAVGMLRAWKGTTLKDNEPIYNERFCGVPLEAGNTYIFYTFRDVFGPRTIHRCSRVIARRDNGDDLLVLGPAVETSDQQRFDAEAPKREEQLLPYCPPRGCTTGTNAEEARHGFPLLIALVALAFRRARRSHA